ncbi:hypothetical protein ACO1KB_18810 [Leptospira interrogans serovar Szwajizak]|uniref:hypothetical protein n=1 Tax=Leptospira interrogans TaxID=173 RepID=UPI003CF5AC3C
MRYNKCESDCSGNSEGIEAKSAVASLFSYEICERFAQIFLRRTHVKYNFLKNSMSLIKLIVNF